MYSDFKELLSALNAHQARYLIVGGYAVSFHAEPRATKDLDILISPDVANGKAVYAALAQFGAPVEGLSAKDFTEPGSFFRIGTPPVMVDILSRISGVEFEGAWQSEIDQPALGGYEKNLRAQARGREEWLEYRRKQAEKSAGAPPERSGERDLKKDPGIDDDIEL
jgi:hypothetical protein